jgi:hypothetical protein
MAMLLLLGLHLWLNLLWFNLLRLDLLRLNL